MLSRTLKILFAIVICVVANIQCALKANAGIILNLSSTYTITANASFGGGGINGTFSPTTIGPPIVLSPLMA